MNGKLIVYLSRPSTLGSEARENRIGGKSVGNQTEKAKCFLVHPQRLHNKDGTYCTIYMGLISPGKRRELQYIFFSIQLGNTLLFYFK